MHWRRGAVPITGGFGTSEEVKQLSDERGLPVISCKHDTFTVASIINRAMYDRLIQRKIMRIEDIVALATSQRRCVPETRWRPSRSCRMRRALAGSRSSMEGPNYRHHYLKRCGGQCFLTDGGQADDQKPDYGSSQHAYYFGCHTMASEGIDLAANCGSQMSF